MFISHSTRQNIVQQLNFSASEIIGIGIATSILVAYSYYHAWADSSRDVAQIQEFSEGVLSGAFSSVTGFLGDTVITADVATMIFWAAIGALVYILGTAIVRLLNNAGWAMGTALAYSHPKEFNRFDSITISILTLAVRFIILFAFLLYSITLLTTLIPTVHTGLKNALVPLNIGSLIVVFYIIVCTVLMHVWVVLLRLAQERHNHPDHLE